MEVSTMSRKTTGKGQDSAVLVPERALQKQGTFELGFKGWVHQIEMTDE